MLFGLLVTCLGVDFVFVCLLYCVGGLDICLGCIGLLIAA